MSKIESQKGASWALKTRVSNQEFTNYDFSKTNFNSAIFEGVTFKDCLFDKSVLAGTKVFPESSFEGCIFRGVDLSNSTVGSHKGLYKDCVFEKCSFRGKEFNFTVFQHTTFDKCKIKGVNFNASSFAHCKFIGPMDDTTFNGIYDTNKGQLPVIDYVDFSAAKFGEFVTFVDCQLATSTPPAGSTFDELLYHLYRNDASVLSTGSTDRIVLTKR